MQHHERSNAASDDLTPDDASSVGSSARRMVQMIRSGLRPSDLAFDRFLTSKLREASGRHWTPTVVAARAAEWIDALNVATVVDIGSGAGKFCVVAALYSRCTFLGVEQRPHLVEAATQLAATFDLQERVRFVEGRISRIVLPHPDLYYLYNPFGENLFGVDSHLDEEVELSERRYEIDVEAVEMRLEDAPVGTYLLTYNGFGGEVPSDYHEVYVSQETALVLRLWQKASTHRS